MNITMEQVEKLREYADVSYKEAREALEASGGDILQAVIDLENQGKTAAPAGGTYSTKGKGGQGEGFGQSNQNPGEYRGAEGEGRSTGETEDFAGARQGAETGSGSSGAGQGNRGWGASAGGEKCWGGIYIGNSESQNQGSSFGDLMRKLWQGFCCILHKGNTNRFEVRRKGEVMLSVPVTVIVLFLVFFFWVTLPLLIVGLFFGCKYRFRGPDLERESINKVMDSASDTAESIKRAVNEDIQKKDDIQK